MATKTRARKAPAKKAAATRKPDPLKHDGEALLARAYIEGGRMFLRPEESDADTEGE